MPSNPMKADDGSGSASAVMPVLLYVAARLAAGTCTCAALISVLLAPPGPPSPPPGPPSAPPGPPSAPPPPALREIPLAGRFSLPALRSGAGAVTENVFDAEPPGATAPTLTWPAGDRVQPDGTLIDIEAADSGRLVGLRSV